MGAYRKYMVVLAAVWGGCLAVGIASYLLVLSPQRKNLQIAAGKLAEKQKLYDSILKASCEEERAKLLKEVEQRKEQLHDFAVDSENFANLTFDISRIAGEKQLASFSTKAIEDDQTKNTGAKFLRENRIEVHFDGDFAQFASFLNALERHRPVVFVDRFRIVRATESGGSPKVDMDLAILVRKRPES